MDLKKYLTISDEVQKALALFMFDSVADLTVEALKAQRNKLIKAFHPDQGESDEAYAKKINAAYELLSDVLARNGSATARQSA